MAGVGKWGLEQPWTGLNGQETRHWNCCWSRCCEGKRRRDEQISRRSGTGQEAATKNPSSHPMQTASHQHRNALHSEAVAHLGGQGVYWASHLGSTTVLYHATPQPGNSLLEASGGSRNQAPSAHKRPLQPPHTGTQESLECPQHMEPALKDHSCVTVDTGEKQP